MSNYFTNMSNYRTEFYRTEFPDFKDDFHILPGFVDSSWHNDVSPSIRLDLGTDEKGETYEVRVWQDYADFERRECGNVFRYSVTGPYGSEGYGEGEGPAFESHTWEEVVAFTENGKRWDFWCA